MEKALIALLFFNVVARKPLRKMKREISNNYQIVKKKMRFFFSAIYPQ